MEMKYHVKQFTVNFTKIILTIKNGLMNQDFNFDVQINLTVTEKWLLNLDVKEYSKPLTSGGGKYVNEI